MSIDWCQPSILTAALPRILEGIQREIKQDLIQRCMEGQYHDLYRVLRHDINILSHGLDLERVRWIMKCRCELLHLNYIPWIPDRIQLCALCNTREIENTEHFLARCPILGYIRKFFFGKTSLSHEELVETLDGKDWEKLFKFAKTAWAYRRSLIQEFNYN